MATLNNKLYTFGNATFVEFFDANNPVAGWQIYSQASFAVFFFNGTATTAAYTLCLHGALAGGKCV